MRPVTARDPVGARPHPPTGPAPGAGDVEPGRPVAEVGAPAPATRPRPLERRLADRGPAMPQPDPLEDVNGGLAPRPPADPLCDARPVATYVLVRA